MSTDEQRTRFASHNALVGLSVRVRLQRDRTFISGVLYGVDPESGDAAVLQPSTTASTDSRIPVKIVMGHAIDSIELDETITTHTLASVQADAMAVASTATSPPVAEAITTEERDVLVQRLRRFLDQRFIPHGPLPRSVSTADNTDDVVVFGGAATLRFPFDARSIECTNEQILMRLQTLLTAFQAEEE